MATFTYDAKDSTGNAVSGLIEAADTPSAASALRAQGLWPTRLEPMRLVPITGPPRTPHYAAMDGPTRIDAAPFLVSAPLAELALMYRQMATLMNAGVPIVQALTTLAQQTGHARLRQILRECATATASGDPLSSTMARYPSVFTQFQLEMIRAGETSGTFEIMCSRIAGYLEREIEIRRKLKGETLYPKIVLALAGCVLLLLGFLKSGAQGALGPLRFGSEALVIGLVVWWMARYLNQFPAMGASWDHFKMLIPGVGNVARKYATARFARALGTLYAGGVLLPNAVGIAARACGNRAIAERMLASVPALMAGNGLSTMLAQSGLLSPLAIQMARTGEETGNLDGMMEKVADYLESEADLQAQQLAKFAGVAALILAAVVVGFIAVSFYGGMLAQATQSAEG